MPVYICIYVRTVDRSMSQQFCSLVNGGRERREARGEEGKEIIQCFFMRVHGQPACNCLTAKVR